MSCLDAKFGPAPVDHRFSGVPPHTVLLVQLVTCVLVLVLLQPPFVLSAQTDAAQLDYSRVAAVALLTSGLTCALHMARARPVEAITRVCEAFYRAG